MDRCTYFQGVLRVAVPNKKTGSMENHSVSSIQGHPGDTLSLRLPVQLKFLQGLRHCTPGPQRGLDKAALCSGMGQPDLVGIRQQLPNELLPHIVWSSQPHICRPQGRCHNGRQPLFEDC